MNNTINNRWSSFSDELFLQDIFNIFNTKTTYPYNIYTYKDKVIIEVPLAGYKRDNISLETDENVLSLRVSKKENTNDGKLFHHGISNKDLLFRWNLNSNLDQDNIDSVFEDGLLTINIKAKQKQDTKKQITIK